MAVPNIIPASIHGSHTWATGLILSEVIAARVEGDQHNHLEFRPEQV